MVMLVVATMLLTGCSNNDEPTGDDDLVALTIDVAESGWADESFSVSTRSGETIDGLKAVADIDNPADGEGFCLHAVNLLGATTVRRQVVWNATTGQWNSGQLIYWQRTSADDYFRVYAYAPYKTTDFAYKEVSTGDIDENQKGEMTFATTDADANGTNIDLLYAGAKVNRTNGRATLDFKHAMAKISFGTITNNTGTALTLNNLSLSGDLWKGGDLNLTTGTWSHQGAHPSADYSPAEKMHFDRNDFNPATDGNQTLALSNGEVKSLDVASFVLIPGPTVTITLTFSSGDTFSFNTTLEQGKDKTYNITVEKNFEVVIE